MKLVYFKEHYGRNFGDLLNDRIFPQLLPGFFDEAHADRFIGIGSILGLPFAMGPGRKVVFSSGFAYGDLPEIDDSYEFHCVRGPLTVEALGLDPKLAVADGAYLLRALERPTAGERHDCSIMLHWDNLRKYDWRPVCEGAGLNFIDPAEDVDSILRQIAGSRLVLAEAMHAAIAADALGVPWIPIACYGGVNAFKWRDFMSAVEMDYRPERIRSLYAPTDYMAELMRRKSGGRVDPARGPWRQLVRCGLSLHEMANRGAVEKRLAELSRQEGGMSRRSVCEGRCGELVDRLEKLRVAHA